MKFKKIVESKKEIKDQKDLVDEMDLDVKTAEEKAKEDIETNKKVFKDALKQCSLVEGFNYTNNENNYTVNLKNRSELAKLIESLKQNNIKHRISRSKTEGYRYDVTFKYELKESNNCTFKFEVHAVDDKDENKVYKEFNSESKAKEYAKKCGVKCFIDKVTYCDDEFTDSDTIYGPIDLEEDVEKTEIKKITTPRGTFEVVDKTEDELRKDGYGYHHSGNGYKIFVKNNQAVAIKECNLKENNINQTTRKVSKQKGNNTPITDEDQKKEWEAEDDNNWNESLKEGSLRYSTLKKGDKVKLDKEKMNLEKIQDKSLLDDTYEVVGFWYNQQLVDDDKAPEHVRDLSGLRIKNDRTGKEYDINRFQLTSIDESLKEGVSEDLLIDLLTIFHLYESSFPKVLAYKYPEVAKKLLNIALKEEPMIKKYFNSDEQALKEWLHKNVVDEYFNYKYESLKKKNESLDTFDSIMDFNRDIYNALARVCERYQYKDSGVTMQQLEGAVEWFTIHAEDDEELYFLFEEDNKNESLKENEISNDDLTFLKSYDISKTRVEDTAKHLWTWVQPYENPDFAYAQVSTDKKYDKDKAITLLTNFYTLLRTKVNEMLEEGKDSRLEQIEQYYKEHKQSNESLNESKLNKLRKTSKERKLNENEIKELVKLSNKKNLKEGYYDYMDKDYADILDQNVDVYDLGKFIADNTDGQYEPHYMHKAAIIVTPSGKGCIADYEAIGQDFNSVNDEVKIPLHEKETEEVDEQGNKVRHISLMATHSVEVPVKDIINEASKQTMTYKEFFNKYKYNDRCAHNFKELIDYLKNNGMFEEEQTSEENIEECNLTEKKTRQPKWRYNGNAEASAKFIEKGTNLAGQPCCEDFELDFEEIDEEPQQEPTPTEDEIIKNIINSYDEDSLDDEDVRNNIVLDIIEKLYPDLEAYSKDWDNVYSIYEEKVNSILDGTNECLTEAKEDEVVEDDNIEEVSLDDIDIEGFDDAELDNISVDDIVDEDEEALNILKDKLDIEIVEDEDSTLLSIKPKEFDTKKAPELKVEVEQEEAEKINNTFNKEEEKVEEPEEIKDNKEDSNLPAVANDEDNIDFDEITDAEQVDAKKALAGLKKISVIDKKEDNKEEEKEVPAEEEVVEVEEDDDDTSFLDKIA